MKTWLFVGKDGCCALSKKRTGCRLPARLGPWALSHMASLDRSEESNLTAFRSIEAKGYFVMGYADPRLTMVQSVVEMSQAGVSDFSLLASDISEYLNRVRVLHPSERYAYSRDDALTVEQSAIAI